jgi:dipeptidyl-peptidase-4
VVVRARPKGSVVVRARPKVGRASRGLSERHPARRRRFLDGLASSSPGARSDPHLSPDATRVAYVRDDDLYVLPLDGGAETRLTRGGSALRPNGLSEFLAQEEFGRQRGFWWSPDSTRILYQQSDLSELPEWTIFDPAHPEHPPRVIRYPLVGAPHAEVRLAIVSVAAPKRAPVSVRWDARRHPYLMSVAWPKHAPPTIEVRDRRFRHSAVLAIDPDTGATQTLLSEEDAAWLNMDASVPRWLPDGSAFLWSTERNG